MKKITMPAVKSSLEGKRVTRLVEGLLTVEDIDGLRERILNHMTNHNIPHDELVEDEVRFSLKSSPHFWIKPKLKKTATGTIHFRSRDYYFVDDIPQGGEKSKSYGNLTDMTPLEDGQGFVKQVTIGKTSGTITYRLIG